MFMSPNLTDQRILILLMIILLLNSPIQTTSSVIWDDDFNDGNLDDWELATYYSTDISNDPLIKGENIIANVNKMLQIPDGGNVTHQAVNWAERESTQVYGHWSFDIDASEGSHSSLVYVYRDPTPESDFSGWTTKKPNGFEGYVVGISTFTSVIGGPGMYLGRFNANFTNEGVNATSIEELVLDTFDFSDKGFSNNGIYHVDITRDMTGNSTVYVNSIKVMSAIDDTYTVSESIMISSFRFTTSYDNIIVDDDPKYTITGESESDEDESPVFIPLITLSLVFIIVIHKKKTLY